MSRLGPLLSPVVVGRDDLLDQAERRVAEAAASRGRMLLIAGEAGIGKTRLIASIERKAKAAGFRSANGLVAPADADVPAAAILDLARTMQRVDGLEPVGRALLDRMRDAESLTQGRRRALVHDLSEIIAGGVDRPTILWFDDLQWADEVSLDVVGELAREAVSRRLLVLGAYRTDEVAPGSLLRGWRSRLLSQRLADEARLGPLSPEETLQVGSIIMGVPLPREVAQALYERTDGIPLHIEELLGALPETDRLDARAIRDSAVPDTLEDAIVARIGRLSPDAQAAARAGAVIGRFFVPDVLAGIMDLPVTALDAPLVELVEHGVISAPGIRGLYDFRHQLLRDALYRTVPPSELRRFHARAAEFGRGLEGATEVHASVHYERAGMREEAFRSAVAGARAASRVLAHREALDLFRRALDNLPVDLSDAERADILEEACRAAAAREDVASWRRWATDALRIREALGDRLGMAQAMLDLASVERRNGGAADARLRGIDEILAILAGLPDSAAVHTLRSDVLYTATIAAVEGRDLARAEEAARAGMDASLLTGDPKQVEQADSAVALVEIVRGDLEAGRVRIESAARRAIAAGHGDAGITALRWAGDSLVQVLDYRAAIDYIEEGIRYGDSVEQSFCPGILTMDAAVVAWADGRWSEADSKAREVLALRGSARAPGMARLPLAFVALGRGEFSEARRWAAEALAFAEASMSPDLEVAARWAQAEIALIARDPASAVDLTERALARAESTDERAQAAPLAVTGARALLAAGRPADAARWVDRVAVLLEGTPWGALPALDHARGIVALAAGSTGIARSALERAVAGWDAMPRTWEALWARLDLVTVLLRTLHYAEAAALVGDVRERATALDSRPLLERADELARQARGHVDLDDPWHPLSTRELEVARLIAAGYTNPAIAEELGIAPKTVSAHVEHILAKLGVARRTEVAAWVATVAEGGRPARGRERQAAGSRS